MHIFHCWHYIDSTVLKELHGRFGLVRTGEEINNYECCVCGKKKGVRFQSYF